ncbi:MAG: two-component regulator propeller domain-containing protein [Bacteroidales bacterium]
MYKRYRFFIAFVLMLLAGKGLAQEYTFRSYTLEEGLTHPFVYSINTDRHGYLWFATGDGLCKYDGYTFERSLAVDSLSEGFVTASYTDTRGNLWFGHNSGDVTFYNGETFKHVELGVETAGTINSIVGDGEKYVYIVSQNNGIIRLTHHFKADTCSGIGKSERLYEMTFVNDEHALIATSEGPAIYSIQDLAFKQEIAIQELSYIKVQAILPVGDGLFWIGTEDMGIWRLSLDQADATAYQIQQVEGDERFQYANVQALAFDGKGYLWAGTFGNGVYKIPVKGDDLDTHSMVNFTTENGLANNFVKTLKLDWEENMWMGTYGGGVDMSFDEAFTFQYNSLEDGNITAVAQNEDGLWLAFGELLYFQEEGTTTPIRKDFGLPQSRINHLYTDEDNTLWIATANRGVYSLSRKDGKAKRRYFTNNSLSDAINHITGDNTFLYFSTQNGVVKFNRQDDSHNLLNTDNGFPHNNIKSTYVTENGDVWVATSSNGIFTLDLSKEYTIEGNYKLEFTGITQDQDGVIWATTYGDGVFRFVNDSLAYYSEDQGLKSNYCYAITCDEQGNIWVGHRLGLSMVDADSERVYVYGQEDGIRGDVNPNTIAEISDGRLLFGTTKGAVVCNPQNLQKNTIPPRLHIEQIHFSGNSVKVDDEIEMPFDYYKLEIDFVALSYRRPEKVTYQYKLDGYDFEWSEMKSGQNTITYPRVGDGEYTLLIRACNADGICVEEPLMINVKIKPPLWKRWWFITLLVLAIIGLVYFIIYYRERRQKALQAYLEAELAQRTKEVLEQHDLLERKNKDITDSINYAKRIQKSILPSTELINQLFDGMFVYYKPRDIVSGDFYWFDRVNENKLLIICADSTGHGVPGAFMSMIGTTLIKDICNRPGTDSPASVLRQLDHELQGTLNQNLDAERAHDGMDIIVCELDVNTKYMRFASAMRPIILYKDKRLQYVRGSKCSIGGEAEDTKKFENIGFQLSKGDIVYMFSDGYPDQFGGPRGKKFKLARLKNMLADICEKPMEEQEDAVSGNFEEWRGKHAQVDDVLFMGVKV